MPAYLVQAVKGHTRINGANAMVVFAADAPDARAVANSHYPQDPSGAFDGATVTEIVAATGMAGLSISVALPDLDAPVTVIGVSTGLSAFSAAIAAGGGTYSVNDVLTVVGGTFTRAATFRVTSVNSGAVDGIELVDPGEYTVLPGAGASTTASPDNGSSCTLTLTGGTGRVENCAAALVSLLNATADITTASIDFGDAGGPLLLISDGSTDDIGDKVVSVSASVNGVAIPSLVSTITSEGASSEDLSVLLPAATYPSVISPVAVAS